MKVKFINEKALAPMLRAVQWREDRAPHRSGTFRAQILQGSTQSQGAGPSLSPVTADQWSVRLPPAEAANPLAAYIAIGDELTIAAGLTLAVQQIARALDGFILLTCTALERAPAT
ncbi:MAG: hypothetical protein IJQ34_02200 [Kiritimatiellae bacterium]|nr:hypothetical protein [Kiritimatiellia bacterium]